MKNYLKYLLSLTLLLLITHAGQAGWGIQGIYVFGDGLSDSGNAAILNEELFGTEGEALFPVPPYYEGRASNGPVWIEIAAEAYGYEVTPHLDGGRNFAYIGAETGSGLSGLETPNFLDQVAAFQEARDSREIKNVHPKDLFVIWVGINEFLRILDEVGEVTTDDIELAVGNIVTGIELLSEEKARLFLVPTMPAVHQTTYIQELGSEEAFTALEVDFNEALEAALLEIEEDKKITIYRFDARALFEAIHATPEDYGLVNTIDPLILNLPAEEEPVEEATDEEPVDEEEVIADFDYLFWDTIYPTVEGHALIAQSAMNIIPIGSWWGHSVARGPDGTAFLGMGWIDDSHWPWLYSYSLNEGEWMWVYDESGSVEGFISFIPKGYKWVWVNAMSGWMWDYSTGQWMPIEDMEAIEEDPDDDEDVDEDEEEEDDEDEEDVPDEG